MHRNEAEFFFNFTYDLPKATLIWLVWENAVIRTDAIQMKLDYTLSTRKQAPVSFTFKL